VNNDLPIAQVNEPESELIFGNDRILVVEDALGARNIAQRVLRSLGYHVEIAADAAEAVKMLDLFVFDMLFTDIIMPGVMDGLALAKYTHLKYSAMKIILLSGFSVTPSAEVIALGAFYITKPYRKAVLAKLLRQCFDSYKDSPGEVRNGIKF
jgi:CheY-like chemotaxis protein